MTVSVIIPNYNHSAYLQRRVNSVLEQTYQDFEVIILDDCSTDGSRDIIEQYRYHSKVSHIVYNDKNSGSTFKQWKKGLNLASGKWIWIAESDDWADKNFLQKLCAISQDQFGIICSNSYHIDEQDNTIDMGLMHATWLRPEIIKAEFDESYTATGLKEISKHLIYNNTIYNASAALVKRSLLEKFIRYADRFKMYGDWILWTQILSESNFAYCCEPLNYYRTHQNNVRTQVGDKSKQLFNESIELRKHIREIILNRFNGEEKERLLIVNNRQVRLFQNELIRRSYHDHKFLLCLYLFIRSLFNKA